MRVEVHFANGTSTLLVRLKTRIDLAVIEYKGDGEECVDNERALF